MRTLFSSEFSWGFSSKKRRRHHQSRVDFYEGRNALVSKTSFESIFNSHNLDTALSTNKSIRFFGIRFGQSLKEAIKKLGKPNYKDQRPLSLKQHNTIYYRLTIKEVKCILQLHFYQDSFFFGKMEIRSSNPQIKRDIAELVCQKYGVSEKNWIGSIFDENGHKINIKQNIIPSVSYVTGDQEIIVAIKTELAAVKTQKRYGRLAQAELLLDMV